MNRSFTLLAKAKSQFRMWMPNMPMTMVSAKSATADRPATATFRVMPKMTKHEIQEYLEKIYDLPVAKVNTANYAGKRKRIYDRKLHFFKYRDFKKATVTFDSSLQDVGKGTRINDVDE